MPSISQTTFSDAGGAVSDLFSGFGAQQKADLQAQGLRITADGTLITAQGTRLQAQGTLINAESLQTKAQGDLAEASNYDIAANLAEANAAYTAQSTRLQQYQQGRQITQALGSQRTEVAGSGFTQGGSAGDLLRDSASQGALAKATLGQQGIITEAGYQEQAQSYQTLSAAGKATAAAEETMAGQTQQIAAGQESIADQQVALAGQQDQLADATQAAGKTSEIGGFLGGALKGAAAIASLFP